MKNTKNKILSFILLNVLFLSFFSWNVFAWDVEVKTLNFPVSSQKLDTKLNRAQAFDYIVEYLLPEIPKSYKYINLDYKDLKKTDKNYSNIQKLVYEDVIPNTKGNIFLYSKINAFVFYRIVEKYTNISLVNKYNIEFLKWRELTLWDLYFIDSIIQKANFDYEENLKNNVSSNLTTPEEYNKFLVMMDVYNTILSQHYYHDKIDRQDLLNWAVSGLADSVWDPYTTYFPPVESQNFENSLSWELEWIWIYVEFQNGWILRIISPLDDSPALKAWLKWGDIISKVDWVKIDETFNSTTATNLIKWKAWTKVKLEITRWSEIFEVEVVREKILIKDVEYQILDNWVFYVQIRSFWDHVYEQLKNSMEVLNKTQNIKKVVFDLRNNPGWYLDKVSNILSLFVKKWEPVAVIWYKDSQKINYSLGYDMVDLNKYDVYFLQNSWTASASEIMIWTLKDYFPKSTIVWENSFWKWSVQTMKTYSDWTSFKYTIAKWYTWLTQTWIDKVWIKPDVEISLDEKSNIDNQLQYILNK